MISQSTQLSRHQPHSRRLPQLARILDALAARFGITAGAEVSMEADPGTFDAAKLRAYMALGVSRFSIGVQAFQQACTRCRLIAVTDRRPACTLPSLPACGGRPLWGHFWRQFLRLCTLLPDHLACLRELEACGSSRSRVDAHVALAMVTDAAPTLWATCQSPGGHMQQSALSACAARLQELLAACGRSHSLADVRAAAGGHGRQRGRGFRALCSGFFGLCLQELLEACGRSHSLADVRAAAGGHGRQRCQDF